MGLLEGMGYTKVRHYVGGMADWLEHGAAVEKSAALIEAPPVRSSARQNIRRRLSWLEISANWPLERLVGFWVKESWRQKRVLRSPVFRSTPISAWFNYPVS